ncbi:MAG: type II toxin-antitoxin system RatA family toxin [Candidatus Baltobacteraceae bacterium]
MIQTHNEIEIDAPPQRIFQLASDTMRWPQILPHYRSVRKVGQQGTSQILEMAAMRDCIPVRWTAQQWNDGAKPAITFHHLAGWTRGMHVQWSFERNGSSTLVSIIHELDFAFPVARDFLGKYVVSDFFVHNIAGKTLQCIKDLCEA